jgi:hypothetical protein
VHAIIVTNKNQNAAVDCIYDTQLGLRSSQEGSGLLFFAAI